TEDNRDVCGDSICSGGFTFFSNNPCRKKMDYIQVWQEFSKMFKQLGYTPIKRYPVVARWNSTMEFTIASIAAFQPYVVSGEVEPPANPLVIPQFCLRFGDVDNVGYTGSHMTGFVMIGQHAFVPKEQWDQDKVFHHIKKWLNDGLGLPDEEIIFHEDAWAGGGNAGPCMEYFSRGVELGNQVYMLYEQTPDGKLDDLKLKVLDMGMGHERNAWFSQATNTIYEAVFPTVVQKLLKQTGVKYNNELMRRFIPYAGKLNLDEVEDIDKAWKDVSKLVGIEVEELKKQILPLAGIYSIAEHTRALLFALNDGALPSNVGGGYNLRVLIRRSLGFIDQFQWDIKLSEVCRWHAAYLKPLFPELMQNLDNIEKILEVETHKHIATKHKTKQIVQRIIKKKITEKMLIQLYDSNGIAPELVQQEAAKLGITVQIPPRFYAKVSELHEQVEQEHATTKQLKLDLDGIPETEVNYYDDYKKTEFSAKVLKIVKNNVILDKTLFYPTSGGQLHDKGTINGIEVVDVFKQGPVIIHVLNKNPDFKKAQTIKGKVDLKIREQISQHHTATHIINAAARKVLGNHINQAGAKKSELKAHLDITHYQSISDDELKQIEKEANKIVKNGIPINKKFYPRREAEDKFGMDIYQGGAVPGKKVRIIEIKGVDVEACGGTHLNNTSETGQIKIIKSTKVQDGIVRLEFVAGKASSQIEHGQQQQIDEIANILQVQPECIPTRTKELFEKWKIARKAVKRHKKLDLKQLELTSCEKSEGDILKQTAQILKTQPDHLPKTIKRFKTELDKFKRELLR
ncbi:alanine--tRNA ligase, partial [Candidatus Woesearchaeota archaeon]|nr:alanine--tRNA ligase [Candidatus Woesearchaeota archaeon]